MRLGPLAPAVLPMWLSVILWFSIDSRPLAIVAISLVFLVSLLLTLSVGKRGSRQQTVPLVLFAAFIGVGLSLGLQQGIDAKAMAGVDAYFSSHSAVIELSEQPVVAGGVPTAQGRLKSVDGRELKCFGEVLSCSPRVSVRFPGSSNLTGLNQGTTVSVTGLFRPARSGSRESAIVKVQDFAAIHAGSSIWSFSGNLRNEFERNVAGAGRDATALVTGFAVGVTTDQSPNLRQAMKVTGLTHLTAVSGANCVIVCGAILFLVGRTRLSRRGRLAASGLALLAYVAVVGQQPSVLRAATMVGAVFLAQNLGRRIAPIDALSAAVLVLLVADPWLAVDFGFALSTMATIGLLVLSRPMAELVRVRFVSATRLADSAALNWLIDAGAVVAAASLPCLPLTIALSGSAPLYALPANLLAEPLVAPATILGITGVAVVWFAPWLTPWLTWPASLLTGFVAIEAEWFASLPFAALPWPAGGFGVLLAALMALSATWLLVGKALRRTAWVTFALCAAVAMSFGLVRPISGFGWPGGSWFAVACDVGQGDALVLRSQGQVAVIDVGRDDKPIDDCLTRLGVNRIDLLVLTHFDADHVAGLPGALNGRRVVTIMETPWVDARPQVAYTKAEVARSGARVILAQQNLTGAIGAFTWRVLTPSKTAIEAEDSNDGSIGMYWQLPVSGSQSLGVLTLADLGERGQMRMVESNPWLVPTARSEILVVKVAHHGSADCYPELYESLAPDLALISVGRNNGYGHPTQKAIHALELGGAVVERTDQAGSLAVQFSGRSLRVDVTGGG